MLHSWQRALKFGRNFCFGETSSGAQQSRPTNAAFFLPVFSPHPRLLITVNPFMFSVYLGNIDRRLKLTVS